MITIIHGVGVGSGKSYYTTSEVVLPTLSRGGVIYYSHHYKPLYDGITTELARRGLEVDLSKALIPLDERANESNIHEYTPIGTDETPVAVVLDECHEWFFTKDTGQAHKRQFFNWLTQSRHDQTDVIFISQHVGNIDVNIRRLATTVGTLRNMSMYPNPLIKGLFWWSFRYTPLEGESLKPMGGGRFLLKTKRIFRCYDTFARRGAHKRSGVVQKSTVKKIPKKMIRIYLVFAAIAFCVFMLATKGKGLWDRYAGHSSSPAKVVNVAAQKVVPEPQPEALDRKKKVASAVLDGPEKEDEECYTGYTEGVCVSTTSGVYWVREPSSLGRVLAVEPYHVVTDRGEYWFPGKRKIVAR